MQLTVLDTYLSGTHRLRHLFQRTRQGRQQGHGFLIKKGLIFEEIGGT
jgi:hypothetical protein